MRIEIAQRLEPFSHLPGVSCLIPYTSWTAEVFPGLLRLKKGKEETTFKWNIQGPVQNFTVQQDLEKGRVRIFGNTKTGYFCYFLTRKENQLEIAFQKQPEGMFHEKTISLPIKDAPVLPSTERLSLGFHKLLDWELACRRQDMREIFPVWFRLGNLLPDSKIPSAKEGMLSLLESCAYADKNVVLNTFHQLFLAAFSGILSPRLKDTSFHGLGAEEEVSFDPLFLLTKGSKIIRALFFKEEAQKIMFLPNLAPECHAGRFTGIKTLHGDEIAFEWVKKQLRCAIIHSHAEREVCFSLQKGVKSFRCRKKLQDKGQVFTVSSPLKLEPGCTLYLDRFEH